MKHIKVTEEQVNELYHAASVIFLGFGDGALERLSEALTAIDDSIYTEDNHLLLDTVIKEGK